MKCENVEIWCDDDDEMNFDDSFNYKEYLPYQSTVQFFLMFLFLWQSTCRVSDVGMNIL